MGAYEGLSHYFDRPLSEYAAELGYHPSNILILEGNINGLQNQHPNIYSNLLSCRHHSDRRTPLQYGQDLVASWLFEDYFIREMQNDFFEIRLSGADRTRMILSNQQVSTNSDYIITKPGGLSLSMELVNDYTGFWYRTGKLHLRDNKYSSLKDNQSLLLAVAISSDVCKYAIFDFRGNVPAVRIESHRPYGYKPAYELSISRNQLSDFSYENVKQSIRNLL